MAFWNVVIMSSLNCSGDVILLFSMLVLIVPKSIGRWITSK
eukprot:CAMPEP_0114118468 /NCGR_PEP_ID=MMETSP0043_2-20121206/5597_1 /TAXON_ID=464988 /ORGANISM="Hemiselmis andersenii, Strain CCMP644" /LENGTH=40 /DNA_ID= /DNA_START= /DNA_END= /DNA_ORIENTATION=